MALLIEEVEQVDHISLRTGSLSDDAFLELCARYPDYDVEVSAEGEAVVMAPVSNWTGCSNSEIDFQLRGWAKRDGRGKVFDSSTIYVLPNGARRSPDASWVSKERVQYGNKRMWRLCPDFLIELRSESDRGVNLRKKMREWMDNGARLAWLIEPKTRTVLVYRLGFDPEILKNSDLVVGEGPVEGFTLDLREVWDPES